MAKIVRNNSVTSKVWCGQTIEPSESYEMQNSEYGIWANDDDLLAAIVAGDAMINNGTEDITSPMLAVNFLKDTDEVDSSGRKVFKTAISSIGSTYLDDCCTVVTGVLSSSLDWQGNAGNYTSKFYNLAGVELAANDVTCVKTVVDYAPSTDYEIIGGNIHVIAQATQECKMWVIGGAIDISHIYPTAVKEMVRNIDFECVVRELSIDGRASKAMVLTTVNVPVPTNKLRFIIKHAAGYQYKFQISVEMFR